jgi:hypothetical protein
MTVTAERRLAGWTLAAMLVTAVAVNASDYSFLVPLQHVRIDTHRSIIEGRAAAPRQYQILVPYVLDPPIRMLATVMPPDKALTRVYAAYHLAALTLLLAVLFFYLRRWFSAEQALIGALVVASMIRIVLRPGEYWDLSSIPESSVFAPASLLEPTTIALGLLLMHAGRHWWLAALVAIAATNSDVAALLPVLFVLTRPLTRDRIALALGYAAIWAAVSIAVRLAVGATVLPPVIGEALTENLQHLPSVVINLALFLGPVWLLIPMGWRRTPVFARRAMVVIPIHLLAIAAWGYWWDVRNLAALYPILLPPALAALFPPREVAELPPPREALRRTGKFRATDSVTVAPT